MSTSELRWGAVPSTLLRTFGWRGLLRRLLHETRRRTGWFRSAPRRACSTTDVRGPIDYAPVGNWRALSESLRERAVARGTRVLNGEYQAYGASWRRLPESPQQWHQPFASDFEFRTCEWWKLSLRPPGIDIKDAWEPARFAWVYDLIRAFAVSGDPRFAEAFHERLAQWQEANPAFLGPQWACGQEVAIRALAVLHASDALPIGNGAADRRLRVIQLLCASGERIADAIGYALSQRNNHGLSEAAGLVHLGLRLGGMHPEASGWVREGLRMLNAQILDQFATDGWYAQHSFTYMRVALEQALYAERALNAANLRLSDVATARLDAAIRLLLWLADERSGVVPNHGANDGARVLPLSNAEYRDFRPVLTLAAVVRGIPLPQDLAPDEETLCWLGARPPPPASARGDGLMSGPSGWAAARVGETSVFLRAGEYRHRPSHVDSLHLDIRIAGREAVTDPGTYAYNAPQPWTNGLVGAQVHNGPILDGEQIAARGPRFLWLSWPSARLVAGEQRPRQARIVAERPGRVRREVLVSQDSVRVLDSSLVAGARAMQVTWLLHPDGGEHVLVEAAGAQRIAAREGDVTGWYSPTFGVRNPSCAVRIVRDLEGEERANIETTVTLRRKS